jgi:LacI family transcriptional regulator
MSSTPVSTASIAQQLGLSQPTVSHILTGRGRFSEATRKRVLAAAKEMGYRPSLAARAMRSRQTRQVGVLIRNDATVPFVYLAAYEMLLGLNTALEELGLLMTVVRLEDARQGVQARSRIFSEHVLDGVVVLADVPMDVENRLDGLIEKVIWLDSTHTRPTHALRRDEVSAGRLAGEAARKAGYRRVLWCGPVEEDKKYLPTACGFFHYSLKDRMVGVTDALQGVEILRQDLTPEFYQSDPNFRHGQVPKLSTLRPGDCVIAYDTVFARKFAYMTAESGLEIGKDIGLGCCDTTWEFSQIWNNLSRVDVSRYELGRRAGTMMHEALNGANPVSHTEPVKWISGTTLPGPNGPAGSSRDL